MHRRALHRLPQPPRSALAAALSVRSCAAAAAPSPDAQSGSGGRYGLGAVLAAAGVGTAIGVAVGDKDMRMRRLTFPPNQLRACCDASPETENQKALPDRLAEVVGASYVKRNYTQKGSRLGRGTSLAHVSPGTLAEAAEVLKLCVAADVAIIPQGANTSLTGASVPRNEGSDRPTIVVNLRRLRKIMPLEDGKKVLCFSGVGIYDLKEKLEKEYKRDSHSILGSIFLNPTVAAGVAFGSGGTQIRKGPAWTERALYLKVNADGNVEVVNTLGLNDGGDPIAFLDSHDTLSADAVNLKGGGICSWPRYDDVVRAYNENKVSRFNADMTGIDCCRSEGKVMILATMHDTFDIPKKSQIVWVACKDLAAAHALKRQVALKSKDCTAKSCEYMNKEVYDGVDRAGRILVKMIELVGMQRLEPLWNLKLSIEMIPLPFTNIICDKFLYWFNNVIPHPLPQQLRDFGTDYDHHMLMEFAEYSDGEVQRLRDSLDQFVAQHPEGHIKYHICEGKDASRANLWRFVVAPAFRTYCIGKGMQGLSIDYALPKKFSEYPAMPEKQFPIQNRWVYSHFGCNVYHEDLVFGPEVDVHAAKKEIKHTVENLGGKLPAEHGHGTEYRAPANMQERWRKMDPLNVMNPGVGGTSAFKGYSDALRMSPAHTEPRMPATCGRARMRGPEFSLSHAAGSSDFECSYGFAMLAGKK
eukprot:CAMPEP_0170289438 /NCGR_PEP_ID=MMETSP0116_2-20130129/44786_1 /TAXON_ID=400756 /ORGANISM="Durinskia baltica, Strain CSIRO CS-38" /LENGTH=697 /DNA_ID=CAMNT_0010540875 /DNA_START=88 /DNA_END=2179 /DNA_ORIENTATION=+